MGIMDSNPAATPFPFPPHTDTVLGTSQKRTPPARHLPNVITYRPIYYNNKHVGVTFIRRLQAIGAAAGFMAPRCVQRIHVTFASMCLWTPCNDTTTATVVQQRAKSTSVITQIPKNKNVVLGPADRKSVV